MRARQNDCVNLLPSVAVHQRLSRRADGSGADDLASKFRLGKLNQFWRSVANDRAVARKSCSKIVDIGLPDRCFGSKNADDPAF